MIDRAPSGAVYLDHPLVEPWRQRLAISMSAVERYEGDLFARLEDQIAIEIVPRIGLADAAVGIGSGRAGAHLIEVLPGNGLFIIVPIKIGTLFCFFFVQAKKKREKK